MNKNKDNNLLEISEMASFLNDLALQTEDKDIADKLIQCSIAISMLNYLTEKAKKGTSNNDG